jgi:hypothetical protein
MKPTHDCGDAKKPQEIQRRGLEFGGSVAVQAAVTATEIEPSRKEATGAAPNHPLGERRRSLL